jgi:ligand-binding sensor domain-containing protein/signal transduction histidine kinase
VRLILFFVFTLLLRLIAPAQQAREYSFKHFSVSSGLSSNTVNAVTQDSEGYIWIATTNGLQRYDGNNFISFKSQGNNPSAIPSNQIMGLYRDQENNLWVIGDNNRIGIFDTRKFLFKEVKIVPEALKMYVPQRLINLPTGELVLHKENGKIYQYNASKNEFVPAVQLFPLPKNWKCTHITWDHVYKKYWLSCDSGLVQYNPVTRIINYRNHNVDNDPVIKAFEKIKLVADACVDQKGDVFFYSWFAKGDYPDLYRYNRLSGATEIHNLGTELNLGHHEIQGFLVQKNGRVWVHGSPFLTEWTGNKQPFLLIPNEYRSEHSIQFDYAYQSFEDRENNVWVATDNGLYYFNPDAQIFNTYKLIRVGDKAPRDAAVLAMAEVAEKIFVGCWRVGLHCFDKNFNPAPIPASLKTKATQLSIWDMAVNAKTGDLWITLQAGGIIVYNPKSEKATEIYPEVFGRSTIRQIDEDTSGNMWFGTQSGSVIKWDYQTAKNDPAKGYELICKTTQVRKIHYDYQGAVWVATLGMGLLKIDTKTNRVVKTFTSTGPPGERLFMDSPSDMTYYNDSTLIVTAGCVNIVNTKTNKISLITIEKGLPSNTTESIERDESGIVWIGMTNGICRLNLQKRITTFYDRRDGIAYDKFNMAGVKELSDSRIVFFTDHNFMVFDPIKIVVQNRPPQPIITSLSVAGRSLTPDSLQSGKSISLKYNNTSISIDFSALSFLQQRKLHYDYMLQGLDNDWIHTDQSIQAIYNYLPPGNYVFKVRTENPDGIRSDETVSIPIIVRSPFWKTWWFYCLILLAAVVLFYLFDQERVKKRRSLELIRTQIASNLQDEINTTLNNINVLSEIAKIKADRNIEQSKEFIDQISVKSRTMIESLDDMLWSIHPENDSMDDTISRIREVTENMMSGYDLNIDLIFDKQLQSLPLNMMMRHELFFFYKETMMFLIQHGVCHHLFVNFKLTHSKLLLEILTECNKPKESIEKPLLNKVQKRINSLNAVFEIDADSKSLSLLLLVPVK